jgi:hypothetical protein
MEPHGLPWDRFRIGGNGPNPYETIGAPWFRTSISTFSNQCLISAAQRCRWGGNRLAIEASVVQDIDTLRSVVQKRKEDLP